MTEQVTVDLDAEGIPDFTPPPGPRFRIYDQVYEGVREIDGDSAIEVLAHLQAVDDASTADQFKMVKELIPMLLTAESSGRYLANMTNRDNPIGLRTLISNVQWLMGQYTGRPTEPDSDSSPGSESRVSGTSSTESTSGEGSTSSDSPPTGS